MSTPALPTLTFTGNTEFIQDVATNGQLASKDYPLSSTKAQIAGGGSWTVPTPNGGTVNFSASGSAYADVGAYVNRGALEADLGFNNPDWQGLDFSITDVPGSRYAVLSWGYSATGAAQGSIALVPGVNATFSADGRTERMYAVIRREPGSKGAGDCVHDLLSSWTSPAGVQGLLPQGTWIVCECDGQFDASLGVQAGYLFNWVKSLKVQGLSGDVGLKIALGLTAALGISLSGKFFLVLSCDENPNVIRYRLFRTATRGWNFSLSAQIDVTPSTGTFLPGQLDDLLKSVLGIHDAQLLKYLQATSLQELTNDGLTDLVAALDPAGDVQKGLTNLNGLLQKWENLPHEVSSLVWGYVDKAAPNAIAQLSNAAAQFANASPLTIQNLLDQYLHTASFANTPVGQWLEAATSQGLFELYESSAAASAITQAAKDLQQVLDGSLVQSTLTTLKDKVDSMLDLTTLETAVGSGNLLGIALWVQNRLASFLGIDTSGLQAEVGKINDFITKFRAKADSLYAATLKALNSTYSFSLQYAYQSSDTSTAMVDLEFDATAIGQLQQAVAGNLRPLLETPQPGVTVRTGTLTHGITRDAKIEVSIPHYVSTYEDINTAFSQENFADTESGRVHLFQAGGKDEDLEVGNDSIRRYAALSLAISGAAKGVNQFEIDSVDFGWELHDQRVSMSRYDFALQYRSIVQTYFNSEFGDGSPNPNHADFDTWVVDWDKFTDSNPAATPNGDGIIGNVWSSMQLRYSSNTNLSWVDALMQSKTKPNYSTMAVAIQRKYRDMIWRSYASDLTYLANRVTGPGDDAFFAWVALPNGDLTGVSSDDLRNAIVSDTTVANLQAIFSQIYDAISHDPNLRTNAGYYDPTLGNPGHLLFRVNNQPNNVGVQNVFTFLALEAQIASDASKGFEAIRQAGNSNLVDALTALETAGLNITKAFNNSDLKNNYDRANVVRYFAAQIFQEAIGSILPAAAPQQVDALLEIAVLSPKVLLSPDDIPTKDQILLQQVMTSFE